MQRCSALVVLLIVSSILAIAQTTHRVEVYAAYSFAPVSVAPSLPANLEGLGGHGWRVAFSTDAKAWFGFTADFTGAYAQPHLRVSSPVPGVTTNLSVDSTAYTFALGPHFTYRKRRISLFGHALVGVVHGTIESSGITAAALERKGLPSRASSTAPGFLIGGGADTRISKSLAWRVQADFVESGVDDFIKKSQSKARISSGLVLHFR